MKRNIFPASIFILVLITILSSSSDFSFAEEEHHSSHENETSMNELNDQLKHEHMDITTEGPHVHNSITAEATQWIGVGALLVAAPVFAIRIRSANKLGYKDVVLILAIGVGIMHVLLAQDHLVDIGIGHGIYFAIAGSAQIGFGLLFISKPTRELAIIGTAGTIGSIVLYFVTRTGELPEPFRAPEGIDPVGIIAKIVEISLVALLIYLALYIKTKSTEIEKTK